MLNNNNQLIAHNFSKAAPNYLQHAMVQRIPALKIIELIKNYYPQENYLQEKNQQQEPILDLGSGCGTINHSTLAKYPTLAFDLCLNMLKINDSRLKINGDASLLPIANNSFSLIISNLMLQWSLEKEQVLNEIWRVLKPNGTIILSTLITPSLHELQQSFLTIDNHTHTLEFLELDDYIKLFNNASLDIIKVEQQKHTIYFPDLATLLNHFKLTGTSLPRIMRNRNKNVNKNVNNINNHYHGLGGKIMLQQLDQIYQTHASIDGKLPLTYNYLIITAKKEQIIL